jgi:hypothetical protein
MKLKKAGSSGPLNYMENREDKPKEKLSVYK